MFSTINQSFYKNCTELKCNIKTEKARCRCRGKTSCEKKNMKHIGSHYVKEGLMGLKALSSQHHKFPLPPINISSRYKICVNNILVAQR